MAEQLKNMINEEVVGKLASDIATVDENFNKNGFMAAIFNEHWDDLALMERGNLITKTLGAFLPSDYPLAIGILTKVIANVESFLPVSLAAFIPMFGLDEQHFDISTHALKYFTQFGSSEFAVRPFIEKYEDKMLPLMLEWATDENEHVRRLASEGCRPALPWGKALVKYKLDPSPILPILENLKNDDAKYVQKSVANNINDIAKTHPDLIAELMQEWYGKSKNTDWIVKHGCRTLLKQGNPKALAIFGFDDATCLEITDFSIDKTVVPRGENLTFSFEITAQTDTLVRLEYGVDFMKANGKQNRKIFQISETSMKKGQVKKYVKTHKFADLTTRKHYAGVHGIAIVVNGVAGEVLDFLLE